MNNKELYLYNTTNDRTSNFSVWHAFPGPYSFAMSSLGYLWTFKQLDEYAGINVERIYTDTKSTIYKNPNLISFSLSFDTDIISVLTILEKYSIPFKCNERNNNSYPIIFAGGPVVSANPEPYSEIFDFFIIGDGEDINLQTVQIIKNNQDKSKEDILKQLSEIEGIYVPKFKKNVKKLTKTLTECVYTPILSEDSFFKNTFILEMSRGCSNRCGFCLASYLNLPLRPVNYTKLLETIEFGLKHTNKTALLGAQISAHPHFHDICNYIYGRIQNGENIEISLSSLRVDAVTDDVIKMLTAAKQKNTTLAIEAGSERLRKVINKHLNEEQIFNAVKIARENGLKGVKFYGMIGLPTETQEDLQELVNLAKRLKNANKGFDISFGISSFVPKPHTPFQWIGRENTKSLEAKSNYLKKEFHKLGIKLNISSIKWDYWQTVLSRGDSKLTDFIIDVYKNGAKLGAFKAAAKKFGINADCFAYETYDFSKTLPWDFIEIIPKKEFLIAENKRLIDSN